MRRIRKPDDDDVPMFEIELVGGEPDETVGSAGEREPLRRRMRRRIEQVRRSTRQIAVLAVSITAAVAVGAAGMRMWDDRAGEQANANTVAASMWLVEGGGTQVTEPTSGTARGSIQVVVRNAGPVPFFLIDVGTDVPNVQIVRARVIGDGLIQPGHDGQFDVTFSTDCSQVQPPGPTTSYGGGAARMRLSVRTAAHELRTLVVRVPQSSLNLDEDWTRAQQFACGSEAPPPMILTWSDAALGFPEAAIHGNEATIPVTAILQRSRPATLRSIDALPGVGIEISSLPLTLQPNAPIAEFTLTAVVTDCAQAADMNQSPYLNAQVEDSGSSWTTPSSNVTADGHLALAILGAVAKICGH